MYQKYHALGKNGVMDGVHEKIMLLPEKPVKASAQKKKIRLCKVRLARV